MGLMETDRTNSHVMCLSYVLCMYVYVAWCSCRTLNHENRKYLWLFCLLLGPFSPYWLALFSLIWWFVPSLIASCYALFSGYPWEGSSFMKVNWRGELGGMAGSTKRNGERGNCSQVVLKTNTTPISQLYLYDVSLLKWGVAFDMSTAVCNMQV